MTAPSYLNSGTRSNTAGATSLTPALPGSRANGNLLLCEVGTKNNAIHSMGGAITPSGYLATSNYSSYTGLSGTGMRDGNYLSNSSIHGTNNGIDEAVTMDLGSVQAVSFVVLAPISTSHADGWGAGYVNSCVLEISNDNLSWTTIVATISGVVENTPKVFTVGQFCRYVRVRNPDGYVGLGDFYASNSPWLPIGDQVFAGSSWMHSLWFCVADGGETAPTVSWSGSVAGYAQIHQYSRANIETSAPIGTVGPAGAGSTGTTHSSTGIDTRRGNSTIVYIEGRAGNTTLAQPSGWTERVDNGSATGTTSNTIGDRSVATGGSNAGNISVSAAASAAWVQRQIELKEPHTLVSGEMEAEHRPDIGYTGYINFVGLLVGQFYDVVTPYGAVIVFMSDSVPDTYLYLVDAGSGVSNPPSVWIDGTQYTVNYVSDDGSVYQYQLAGFGGFTPGFHTIGWTAPGSSLSASAGTFDLNGGPTSLPLSRVLSATAATFAFTGVGTVLAKGTLFGGDAAALSFGGAALGFTKGFGFAADAGVFASSGADSEVLRTLQLPASATAYAFVGAAAGLFKGFASPTAAGVYAFNGASLPFLAIRLLGGAAGSFAFGGAVAGLLRGLTLSADATGHAFAGAAATLNLVHSLPINAGGFTVAGAAMVPVKAVPLAPAAYGFAGKDLPLRYFTLPGANAAWLVIFTPADLAPWYRNYSFSGRTERRSVSHGARLAFSGRRR